jgi:hypothetical protein
MFCSRDRVGHFAVNAQSLAMGDGEALFRLLVTMTMFQRRSDLQIMRVLRGISAEDAKEMTDADTLLGLASKIDCPHIRDLTTLKTHCDLSKDPVTKRGGCSQRFNTPCHLKRHTELLKRYGHFGKVPTSAALNLRSFGANSLAELKRQVWDRIDCPARRATALEESITRSWRVSEKIAAMFLSAVTNKALSGDLAPWTDGIDTGHFVVVDSNVDLFLKVIGYSGPMTYRARREFVQRLARRVPLNHYYAGLESYNPRIVQQALYMFMSKSNRLGSELDCSHDGPARCTGCPMTLKQICSRQHLQ